MAFVTWEDTTSDGSQTTYNIIFPFLDRDHVIVKFGGSIQPTSAYTFLSDSQISLVSPASNGVTVRVQRITPQTVQTDFVGGVILPEANLDDGYLQMLYHTQELQDLYDEAVAGAIATATLTSTVLNNLTATIAPAVTDDTGDGYEVGSYWNDTVARRMYMCQDSTLGAAVWSPVDKQTYRHASTIPGVTEDVDSGYSVGSIGIVDGSPDDLYLCTDVTAGAAVWTEFIGSGLAYPYTHTGLVLDKKSSGLASASTVDLSTATGNYVEISGSTTIASFGTVTSGTEMIAYFTGAPLLTHHATQLRCPGLRDLQLKVGDRIHLRSDASGNWTVTAVLRNLVGERVLPRNFLDGFILSNGTDAVNDIDISAGEATDSTNTANISNPNTLVKQIDAPWTVGSAAGGFPSGLTLTNDTQYHMFEIKRSDTGVIDAGFDTSLTAANLLADATNYDLYRRVGTIFYGTATIIAFQQYGDRILWDLSIQELSGSASTSGATLTIQTPIGVECIALMSMGGTATAVAGAMYGLLSPLNITNSAANSSRFNAAGGGFGSTNEAHASNMDILTDTASGIRQRVSTNTNMSWKIHCHGYIDKRGKQ
jgi:hypothetical protein